MEYDYKSYVPRFDIGNYELIFFSAVAAINIENCMDGREESDGSTEHLSRILEDRVREIQEARMKGSPSELPGEIHVLGYALLGREKCEEYIRTGTDIKIIDVLSGVISIAKDLGNFKKLPESRKSIVSFCTNLTREVMSYQNYQKSIIDQSRPGNPFKHYLSAAISSINLYSIHFSRNTLVRLY